MFVGWVRENSFVKDLENFSKKVLLDIYLIQKAKEKGIIFASYKGDEMCGIITGIVFAKTIFIHNFAYLQEMKDEDKKRLIAIFLKNLSHTNSEKTILLLAKKEEYPLFLEAGFEVYGDFSKAIYQGGAVFNFSNSMSKSINNDNYKQIIKLVDFVAFNEDRYEYILDNIKHSSLILSTRFGYMHSYGLDTNMIKLSPWIVDSGAFDDAEKLLRGVIYHRGLKNLIAFIPTNISEIKELYENYNFKFESGYKLLYKNEKPNINMEMVYGF